MSSKEEIKLSKALEKAENTARIRLFKKASDQYNKLIGLAQSVSPELIPGFGFLARLYLVNEDISDLNGLEYCVNLERLDLRNNAIEDVSPLSGLQNLTNLELKENLLKEVMLADMPNLTL